MEKLFGKTSDFAIKYTFEKDNFNDNLPDFYLELWIKGKQLMSYNYDNSKYTYFGEIQYIIDWMYSNIEYILGYDPFPLPVPNADINAMLYSADEFDDNTDLEFDLWHFAKSRWIQRHCWLSAKTRSIMPSVCFFRRENSVEISWNNLFWKESNVYFDYDLGYDEVDYNSFRNVIISFMQDAAEILKIYNWNFKSFEHSIIN